MAIHIVLLLLAAISLSCDANPGQEDEPVWFLCIFIALLYVKHSSIQSNPYALCRAQVCYSSYVCLSICLSVCPTSSWNTRVLCRVWARERCRISPPRILAECRKKRLNQASVGLLLLCVLCCFAFSGFCLVLVMSVFDLSSVTYFPAYPDVNGTIKNLLTHSPRYCVEAAKLIKDFSCHVLQIIHIHTRYL